MKDLLKAAVPRPVWRALKQMTGRGERVLRSPEALDTFVGDADAAFARSEEEGQKFTARFRYETPRALPSDPLAGEYREAQLALYQRLSGRARYCVDHEASGIDTAQAKLRPYPYATGSARITGDYLIAMGFLLRHFPFGPGARVVEFGPGWGHTTAALSRLGCEVTAVEVDPGFCEVLQDASRALPRPFDVVQTDMLGFGSDVPFDAALFFESFHHCDDPLKMLRSLRELIRPGGAVVFAGEPISDFEMPWGVRLDGASLYAMRKHGWLELGFETRFFLRALAGLGWRARRYRSRVTQAADVIVAHRVDVS